MIGTAKVIVDGGARLRGLPVASIPPHAVVPTGQRVVISFFPQGADLHPIFAGVELGWMLVRWGDKVGWLKAGDVQRDPLCFLDLSHYNGDLIAFDRVVAEGYIGVALKATQGVYYGNAAWYVRNVPRARAAAGDRLGDTFHVMAYHYWTAKGTGRAQALYYLQILDKGDIDCTLRPVIDVERGGNDGVTRKEMLLSVCDYIDTIVKETGVQPIIYGGELLRSLGVVADDFCTHASPRRPDLWFAEYGPELVEDKICRPLGVRAKDGFAWQYAASKDTLTPDTPNYGRLPHGIVGLDAAKPAARQLPDTNVVLGAGDCTELVARYGWPA